MNILTKSWLKVMEGGLPQTIPIANLVNPQVSDLAFSRADFNGAVYQMLIGLLQTAMPPKDMRQWKQKYYAPPTADELNQLFIPYKGAFNLFDTEQKGKDQAPAFMQDLTLTTGEVKDMAALLIEAPGGNGIKNNTDHFVKRGLAEKVCPSCATAALYGMQCAAPSGGVGHRTSLRGGGGLTTLVLPKHQSSLWQKLWLNVLPSDHSTFKTEHVEPKDIFPWLAATRTSEKKGSEVLPTQVNPLQMYWGMPRRFRLIANDLQSGHCDICGDASESLFTQYITKNYGTNYGDGWLHALTPYRFDKNNKKPPLSVKGKQGGLTYKDWLPLLFGNKDGEKAAAVVQDIYINKRRQLKGVDKAHNVWCFAFDMDNMKARCWYENTMPLVEIAEDAQDVFTQRVEDYLALANDTMSILRQSVKQAWASRPKDLKGDTSNIDINFWGQTQSEFFALIGDMATIPKQSKQWIACDDRWRKYMLSQLLKQFEHWALGNFDGDRNLKRIIEARISMKRIYYKAKAYTTLQKRIQQAKKETA